MSSFKSANARGLRRPLTYWTLKGLSDQVKELFAPPAAGPRPM
jgi:hypothetical protein